MTFDDCKKETCAGMNAMFRAYERMPTAMNWRQLQRWVLAYQQMCYGFGPSNDNRTVLVQILLTKPASEWPDAIVEAALGMTMERAMQQAFI